MTIAISESTESLLRLRAKREGRTVDDVAESLIRRALAVEDAEVEAIREGIQAAMEGRERPYKEFIAEHKARYPDP